MSNRKHSAGFTMLEVLITMVILSIGLLGLAGLQANGLKSNHQAYMRTQATLLAYDMSDRMRANMAGVNAGNYDDISGKATATDCAAIECTPAAMALYDTEQWNVANDVKLPSGQGTVSVASGIHTIIIMWDDERTGKTGTGCSGNANVDLKCFNMSLQL